MTLTLELDTEQETRLNAAARKEGLSPAVLALKLVTDHLPETETTDPTIVLLQSWLEEDATNDPEAIAEAERELAEFKQAMNDERERAGARLLYP